MAKFLSYELSLKLKKAGFEEPCLAHYGAIIKNKFTMPL